MTNRDLPSLNRKVFRNTKSRYMEQRDETAATAEVKPRVMRKVHECLYDPFTTRPVERAFVEFVEAEGRLDGAASALGCLMAVKRGRPAERVRPPSANELDDVRRALAVDDGSPLALVRAALAFVREDGPPVHTNKGSRWLYATELCLRAAVSHLRHCHAGGPDDVTCLFVAGWFYARCGRLQVSLQFLGRVRRAADCVDVHRFDWHLPEDVARDTGSATVANGGRSTVWSAACSVEIEVLMAAARGLDAGRALRAVRAAYRLAGRCGIDNERQAPILYELGVRYMAVGAPDRAIMCFKECAMSAVGLPSGLDLEARLRLLAAASPRLEDDGVLEGMVVEALDRRCGRALVAAIAARAHASALRGWSNVACQQFSLAHRLVLECADVMDADEALSTRLNAAVCRTSAYLQSNFQHLSRLGFDLLATEPPHRWTGSRSLLVQCDLKGRLYLDAELYQDAIVASLARNILCRLRPTDDHGQTCHCVEKR